VSTRGVDLTFREVSGLRPFVAGDVNGFPVSLMVHSNASFTAMVTHDVAGDAGLTVGPVQRPGYGIVALGEPSTRGRATAVAGLRVGDDLAKDLEIAVFDVPQDPPVDGMLGIDWLRQRGAVVDMGERQLRFGQPSSGGIELDWDEAWHSFVVTAQVDEHTARFVVSTVAGVVVDTQAIARLGLELGPVVEQVGGPTGTSLDVRSVASGWSLELDGRARPGLDAQAWDLYEYSEQPRPTSGAIDGFLGCDFLLHERAVVDFGRATMALAPSDFS
jgi:predicted aspartyl protease